LIWELYPLLYGTFKQCSVHHGDTQSLIEATDHGDGSESLTCHQKNIYNHLTSLGQTFQALDKFLGHDESHSMEQATVILWESALL